jgi:formate dehydrogenase alpha subunit
MTNSIAEIEKADVILVTGSNTTETHPVIATRIKRAVLYNNAKLIVVDPRKIDLVKYATVWLRQKNGTDVAWLNGLMNVIIKENLHDEEFIKERTEGFDKLQETVKKYTPEYVEKITEIPAEDLIKAARVFGKAEKGSIAYAMGITQHTNGTDNVKSIANLAMITGNVGRENTGVNPLRGQNNVQGACDMGALPNVYPGYQKVIDSNIKKKFEKAWNTELSENNGLTVVEMMNSICDGSTKALYIMGENPMISDANTNHVKHALETVDFLICQDIFLTETAQMADVVFPSASFAEKDGTFTNSERRVLKVNKLINDIGETKADWKIIELLANNMKADIWNYKSWKDVFDEINSVTPQYGGITKKRISKGEKLQWPCPDENHPGTKFLHKGKFARGLGLLTAIEHTPSVESQDKEYPFIMSTGRSLYHYHSGSMTRRSKSLNNYIDSAYCEITKNDMHRLNIKNGEIIKVKSRRGEIELAALESDKPADGCIFIPFHFAEATVNKLTIDKLDPIAKIPEYKVCAVSIEKKISNS